MKYSKLTLTLFLILFFVNSKAQTYSQPAEVISSGGGESTGGNYSNFGVIGETFVDYSVTGANYNTSIGFLYASETVVGVDENQFSNQNINIYPNPNTGEFFISIEISKPENFSAKAGSASGGEIKVLNVLGQVVYIEQLKDIAGKYQKVIDLSGHAKGVYTMMLVTETGTINKKVIIY